MFFIWFKIHSILKVILKCTLNPSYYRERNKFAPLNPGHYIFFGVSWSASQYRVSIYAVARSPLWFKDWILLALIISEIYKTSIQSTNLMSKIVNTSATKSIIMSRYLYFVVQFEINIVFLLLLQTLKVESYLYLMNASAIFVTSKVTND